MSPHVANLFTCESQGKQGLLETPVLLKPLKSTVADLNYLLLMPKINRFINKVVNVISR